MKMGNNFFFRGKNFHCEEVRCEDLVDRYKTPLYVYSLSEIRSRVEELKNHLPSRCKIFYAAKANSNLTLLNKINSLGVGADIVSGGELYRAKKAGFSGKNIVFSGVGKTEEEILSALNFEIRHFNVESVPELLKIQEVAKKARKNAPILFRVNPNISAKTHPHISTGLKQNKFGLLENEIREAIALMPKLRNLRFVGLSCHIGSQIHNLKPLRDAFLYLKKTAKNFPLKVRTLDLGGGLGIAYDHKKIISLKEYAQCIYDVFKNEPFELGIEPGRSIIGPSGILLTKSIYLKKRKNKNILIVDAAMNDLIRPALYSAFHECVPLTKGAKIIKCDVVGPVCESSDVFHSSKKLEFDDHYAFLNAGAYGMSMSSQYNSRPRASEVLIDGKKIQLIRKRESYEDLIENEKL